MNSPNAVRRLVLLPVLAFGLAGCKTTSDVPRTDAPRSDVAVAIRPTARPEPILRSDMRIEPQQAWSLYLPRPGASSKVPLDAKAEAAKVRGLAAADGGRWEEAIAAFKEARERAHAAPSLLYDLALAYDRGGHRIPAVMWYRAWLAAEPDAPNAPVVRFETNRLILETEAHALKLFDEAEALADALSDRPPSPGAKSLRQKALEEIGWYILSAGLDDRGNSVLRKVAALPGAEASKKREYADPHGLFGATWAWDTPRAEEIVKRWGVEYEEAYRVERLISAYVNRGDIAAARKVWEAAPTCTPSTDWRSGDSAWGLLEAFDERAVSQSKAFDAKWNTSYLLRDMEWSCWSGRPDVALRLARLGAEYRTKFGVSYDAGSTWNFMFVTALLGDASALGREIKGWNGSHGIAEDRQVGRSALLMLAGMSPAEAAGPIEAMIRQACRQLDANTWDSVMPLTHYALNIARGQDAKAAEQLCTSGDTSKPETQQCLVLAMRHAASTGRSGVAVVLADSIQSSTAIVHAMNRLPIAGAAEPVLAAIDRHTAAASGGWRPHDDAQSREVWRRVAHATFIDDSAFEPLPSDLSKLRDEKPEQVPALLAGQGYSLWVGAMAARAEE